MIRMERISGFRFQISDWERRPLICNLKSTISNPLAPQLEAISQHPGQARLDDFLLRSRQVVFYSALLDYISSR